MTPYLFYGAGVVLLLVGLGQHGIEWAGDYLAARQAERKEQRTEEAVNAYFQQATNRELFEDPGPAPRRLPTPSAATPLEPTPELAEPLDEFAPAARTGW